MYSVLNTPSEYTKFYISKNITSHNFLLVFKMVETLQCISRLTITRWGNIPFAILIDQQNYSTVGFLV